MALARIPRIPYKYATVAKARFGVQPPTVVNKAAVRDFLRREMMAGDVRVVDIARYLDLAVSLSFIPTDEELMASLVLTTSVAESRLNAMAHPQSR